MRPSFLRAISAIIYMRMTMCWVRRVAYLGYDLANLNLNSDILDEQWTQKGFEMPEIILVKKYYPKRRKKHGKGLRYWKLKRLPIEGAEAPASRKKAKKEEGAKVPFYSLRKKTTRSS